MRYRLRQLLVILAMLLLVLWPASVLAASHFQANVSGLEVFPGIRNGKIVYGTTFVGWVGETGQNANGWQACPPGSNCGGWGIVINYTGTPGIGSSIVILNGVWSLTLPNRHHYSGTVTGGVVIWPSSLSEDKGCGPGVALVTAYLTFTSNGSGSIQGCLDDTHPQTAFPPHVWGTIKKT